jgi:tetratricopeptide (TPR) repeat protein
MTRNNFQTALQLHQSGQLDQAEARYRQILAQNPDDSDTTHLLGVLRLQRGSLGDGEMLIRQAISLRPDVVQYYGNLASAMLQAQRWSEAIACMRQIAALEPNNHALFFRLGKLLATQGQLALAIEALKSAVALVPANPDYRGILGTTYAHAKLMDLAAVELREGIRLTPDDVRFWHNLGSVLCDSGKAEEGLAAFEHALKLSPGLASVYCNKAAALRQIGRHDEAMTAIRRAVEIDPAGPGVQNNLGALLYDEGKLEETLDAYRLAVKHDPNSAGAHWNLARILLRWGLFAEGWEEFEWRLKYPGMPLDRGFTQPQWDGSDPTGKTILLHAEGGFGDALHFIRLVPQVTARGGRWFLECQPALASLLEGTAGVERVIHRGQPLPEFDMQIPLQGLPRVMGIRLDNIPNKVPYLQPAADRVEHWAARLAGDARPRVGLVWAGSKAGVADVRTRSVELFAPLAGLPDIKFYSLQIGPDSAQTPPAGMDWTDYTAELGDFAETAALVRNLDLVITVDTSMAHLAGALAVPVWVVIPFQCDFRWLADRTDSPWYPTMRLFREPVAGDTAAPMAEMVRALREWIDRR